MKAKKVDLVQGSEEWLNYRKRGVGASEVPAIMEVKGAYSTRLEVLAEKVTGLKKELTDYQKQIFSLGHEIEETIRNEQNEVGYKYEPVVFESLENPRMFASLDGWDEETKTILEVKSTSSSSIIALCEAGEVPPVYYAQIQYQLYVTGAPQCTLIVVNKNNNDRHLFTVTPWPEYQVKVAEAINAFFTELDAQSERSLSFTEDQDAVRLYELKLILDELNEAVKAHEKESKMIAEKLLKKYKAYSLIGEKLKIEFCVRKGAVDYAKIPELKEIDLEKYRKSDTEYVKVTLAKGN